MKRGSSHSQLRLGGRGCTGSTFRRLRGWRRSYIGQTDGLPRRFSHYRNPGPTQQTNIRINALLTELIVGGEEVRVSVALGGELTVTGGAIPLDFADKTHRLLAEAATVVIAGTEGVRLDNL